MQKPIIFISHISEERELAVLLKDLIESRFLGMLNVFVSTDVHSISLGQKWLESITDALENCMIEILLCSPKSITRPWIHFEAGAGWIRKIPVIPLCHSGIEPEKLPLPLNLLQAAKVSEIKSLSLLFDVLAHNLGANVPVGNFNEFIVSAKTFEENYTFWDECNDKFRQLLKINSKIISVLKQNNIAKVQISDSEVQNFNSMMNFFTSKQILDSRQVVVMHTVQDVFYTKEIVTMTNFLSVVNDPRLKY